MNCKLQIPVHISYFTRCTTSTWRFPLSPSRMLNDVWKVVCSFNLGVKPRPNGLACRQKLKTWVYLRLRLARACAHLHWLAMTCAHFGRDQICMQVNASFLPFGHPTQANASWVTSINGLANEIKDMSAFKWVFCDLRVLVRKLASAFGYPTNASLYASSTCAHLRLLAVRLTRALHVDRSLCPVHLKSLKSDAVRAKNP